ncbi:MAG: hypothetical protein QXL51_04565 [Candidatus Aenigmatarchaeota archaeon]
MSMKLIGLRHDIDNNWVFKKGIFSNLLKIEDGYNIRSTFFVRVDTLKSEKDWNLILEAQDKGWEIGLHLINTINTPKLPAPREELEILTRKGVKVYGVTPCGTTIGWIKPDINWAVMDELGLKYMEGYGKLTKNIYKTFIFNTHLSLDIYYIRKYGIRKGYELFKRDTYKKILDEGYVTVLTHPEYFGKSVGIWSKNIYVTKMFNLALTFLKVRTLNKVYEKFLLEHKNYFQLLRYIDLYKKLLKEK